ncbi:hypothetical protein NDN08_007046 [Rhodosorus marinus]|uniref:D-glutamate cyclase-like C-terminal domain-containing protein n=1 Tax=Rhodosorus marinus TaxID=101924 RepID=A0AAV8UIV3_9RHOD|nr:hypothetical protein NDN08_007046 [Rhodosorus marinus]
MEEVDVYETSTVHLLERLCGEDIGRRGIKAISEHCEGELLKVTKTLLQAKRVLLTTGFFVPTGQAPETDGPLGAAAIAQALLRGGVSVDFITDPLCASAVAPVVEFLRGRNLETKVLIFPGPVPEEKRDGLSESAHAAFREYDPTSIHEYAEEFYKAHCTHYTHFLSIERVGAADAEGKFYNMAGIDISGTTGRIDLLFDNAERFSSMMSQPKPQTIAIGDGGNEIGMGKVRELVTRDVPKGSLIGSVASCDHLISAGVSNWGGYVLAASLAILQRDAAFLWSWQDDCLLMADLVAAEAVDGMSGKVTGDSVDGISSSVHQAVVDATQSIARTAIQRLS